MKLTETNKLKCFEEFNFKSNFKKCILYVKRALPHRRRKLWSLNATYNDALFSVPLKARNNKQVVAQVDKEQKHLHQIKIQLSADIERCCPLILVIE